MKNRKIATICIIITSFLLTAGIVKAASLTVDSLTVGKQGVGGVTFFNGTIINNTTGTGNTDNPVTFGDNVRIDGYVFRGPTAGSGDNKPFKINDDGEVTGNLTVSKNLTVSGDLTLGGKLTASSVSYLNSTSGLSSTNVQEAIDEVKNLANLKQKVYAGSFDVTQSGDEVATTEENVDCTFPDYTKYENYHWKKISVPEIDFNNMPDIKVYYKAYTGSGTIFPSGDDVWMESGYTLSSFKPGYVYLLYKMVSDKCDGSQNSGSFFTGDYKIVVTYK